MKKLFALGLMSVLFSCSPGEKDTSSKDIRSHEEPSEKSLSIEKPVSSDKWQEVWEKDVAQAKKEEWLVIYTDIDPQTREPSSKTFEKRGKTKERGQELCIV